MKAFFMKITNSISPADRQDKCLFVEIPDLVAASIAGGAALSSIVPADGTLSYAFSSNLNGQVSISYGWGTGTIGDNKSAKYILGLPWFYYRSQKIDPASSQVTWTANVVH